jgi:hypothetical protein
MRLWCCWKSGKDSVVNLEKPPEKKEPFVIQQEGKFRNRWDCIIFCVVVFILITVPLRIGFDIRAWKPWLAPDYLTDLLLVVDIVICSMTTYEVDGEMVKDRKLIWQNYLKGLFFFDLASVLPLDFIWIWLPSYTPWLRANRLIRVIRFPYYFSQWEKVTSLKPSVIRIFKSTFVILGLAHVIGCGFFLVIIIEGMMDETNGNKDFTGTDNILDKPLASKYIRAFYWSFVTMTGYNNTNPHTQLETIFSIVVTMVGISLFATIIGTVGSLVTNLDSSALYFRQKNGWD